MTATTLKKALRHHGHIPPYLSEMTRREVDHWMDQYLTDDVRREVRQTADAFARAIFAVRVRVHAPFSREGRVWWTLSTHETLSEAQEAARQIGATAHIEPPSRSGGGIDRTVTARAIFRKGKHYEDIPLTE
jgi:hypothetical protein